MAVPTISSSILLSVLACVALVPKEVQGEDIRLGFMIPRDECPSCLASFLSAVHYANTIAPRSSRFTVVPSIRDSANLTTTLGGAIELTDGTSGVHAMVADLYSSRVALSSRIAELRNTPMVGYGATSDAFSDKMNFPLFSRVVSPDIYSSRGVVAAVQAFGWGRIGVLYSDDAYGTNYATQLATAADDAGLVIHSQKTFRSTAPSAEIELPIRQLVATGVRVIVLAAVSADVTNAIIAAGHAGATGPGFTWFGADGVTSRELFTGSNIAASPFAAGMLGVFPRYEPDSSQARIAADAVLVSRTWTNAPRLETQPTLPPITSISPWAYYVWDATLLSIHAVIAGYDSCDQGRDGWCLQDRIRSETLPNGATGNVVLDPHGDRPGSYSVVNFQYHTSLQEQNSQFSTVGTVEVSISGTANVSINRSEIIWPGGETNTLVVPSHGDFTTPTPTGSETSVETLIGVVLGSLVVGAVCFVLYRRKMRRKLLTARSNLSKLGNFRQATELWQPPLEDTTGAAAAAGTGVAVWLWQETDPAFLVQHAAIAEADGWVPYPASTATEIEAAFQGGQASRSVTITASNGMTYEVDLAAMTQRNTRQGGRTVPVRRVETERSADSVLELEKLKVPKELIQASDALLPLQSGVLLEVTRTEGEWAYGTALFAEDASIPVGKSGWFPVAMTDVAPLALQLAFQESLGEYNTEQLDPPSTWENVSGMDLFVQTFTVNCNSSEGRWVAEQFNRTIKNRGQLEGIERIQNLPLWQSHAVKKLQITAENNTQGYSLVRAVAWHGTTAEIADKIMQQGFNRSFCGRNMCRFGKGVYFARDASYSAHPTYAQPSDDGLCRMFLCQVAHGHYCEGTDGALTPDVRTGNVLFDSTVDSVSSPGMWVTYHDGQAYPLYLITFKQKASSSTV